jgi:hypothetical protein|tara:strand:- start:14080 stop:14298 length:219 start_codon:yes stop_codon:yes gene_type:complete
MNKLISPTLIEWYKDRNLKNRSGVSINDILDSYDDWMESNHSYIQWVFPNRTASIYNPSAHLLTDEFINAMK